MINTLSQTACYYWAFLPARAHRRKANSSMYRSNSISVCSLPHGIVLSTALHPLLCRDMAGNLYCWMMRWAFTGSQIGAQIKPDAFLIKPHAFLIKRDAFLIKPHGFRIKTHAFLIKSHAFLIKADAFWIKPHGFRIKPHSFSDKTAAFRIKSHGFLIKSDSCFNKPYLNLIMNWRLR